MDQQGSFEETLAAAAAGEAWAFEVLWHALQPGLRRYLRVAAPEDAEDVASETWFQVARYIKRFRGDEGDFRRWLFTIARHQAIGHKRRTSRAPSRPLPPDVLAGRHDSPDPDDPIEHGISVAAALDVIGALPPDQAEAVALRVVGGLSVEDVARILGKRPGTVRVLCHRGLRRLAQILSEDEPPGV